MVPGPLWTNIWIRGSRIVREVVFLSRVPLGIHPDREAKPPKLLTLTVAKQMQQFEDRLHSRIEVSFPPFVVLLLLSPLSLLSWWNMGLAALRGVHALGHQPATNSRLNAIRRDLRWSAASYATASATTVWTG